MEGPKKLLKRKYEKIPYYEELDVLLKVPTGDFS
jgi:hypothetical protein